MPSSDTQHEKTRKIITSNIGKGAGKLDGTIIDYICSILEEGTADFQADGVELCEVLSPLLLDAAVVKHEAEALKISKSIISELSKAGLIKLNEDMLGDNLSILNAPVKISNLGGEGSRPEWMNQNQGVSIVDVKALEAVKSKQKVKQDKRQQKEDKKKSKIFSGQASDAIVMRRPDANNTQGNRDIKINNISLSYGKVELISNATLTLVYGRRYGLVGRNGSGKSTLMRAIAERSLDVPKNLQILHVEQEVVGDDTTVLQNVLAADEEREKLLAQEASLSQQLSCSSVTQSEKNEISLKLQFIYTRLQHIDSDSAESKASSILAGLGFGAELQNRPSKEFSGGWRMRVALARALFIQPDVLLLDEPTNHLDLFAALWLENYLQNWSKTLLIVSHQREFLNNTSTDIIHLTNKNLAHYRGNYDTFEKVASENLRLQKRLFEAQQLQRKHMQKFIDRFRYNAKRASMAQSRVKKLEKMSQVSEVVEEGAVRITFPEPEPLNPPILQLVDATFAYGDAAPIFTNLNLGIDMQSRVALVGPNGCGKSTLLKLLSGDLLPKSGMMHRNPKLRFSLFSQHFVDQLDLNLSALEYFHQQKPLMSMQDIRAHLGSYGLSGDLALRTMKALSGGQKSRVVFANMGLTSPHILLLDEPSNHLDIETIEGLARSLTTFSGGVLLVSHDERLITLVCDEIWKVEDGQIYPFDGDFDDYKNELIANNNFCSLPMKRS